METDRDLIQRIRNRDESAFQVFLERHEPAIRGCLGQIVRDNAAVEDLFQEVCLRIWTRAHQCEGRGSVAGWLARIATNLALNHLRSRRRRRERPLVVRRDAGEDEPSAPGWLVDLSSLGPDALLEAEEQRASLDRLMDDMPEQKREVLRMAHEHEMNMREIAEALGVPEGTAKSRLHYATRRLAEAWREQMKQGENAR